MSKDNLTRLQEYVHNKGAIKRGRYKRARVREKLPKPLGTYETTIGGQSVTVTRYGIPQEPVKVEVRWERGPRKP